MKSTCAALVVATIVSQACAGDGVGRGIGYASCAIYAKRYAENPKIADFMFFTWAQGYMTAANAELARSGHYHDLGGSIDDQEAYMHGYCDTHPLASYSEAVMDLYTSLPLKDPAPGGGAGERQPE